MWIQLEFNYDRYYEGDCYGAKDCFGDARLWKGDRTVAIGYGGSAFAPGLGFRGSVSVAVDGTGDFGIFTNVGGGAYMGAGFSTGASVSTTNAPSINNLEGWSGQTGGGVSVAPGGPGVSYEQVSFSSGEEHYKGHTFGGDIIGPWPTEGHVSGEYSKMVASGNVFHFLIWLITGEKYQDNK